MSLTDMTQTVRVLHVRRQHFTGAQQVLPGTSPTKVPKFVPVLHVPGQHTAQTIAQVLHVLGQPQHTTRRLFGYYHVPRRHIRRAQEVLPGTSPTKLPMTFPVLHVLGQHIQHASQVLTSTSVTQETV